MKRSWLVLVAVLALLAAASFTATRLVGQTVAEPACCEPLFTMLHDYLDLTPDQRREIADIDASYATRRQDLRQKLWDERDHFLAVVRDSDSGKTEALAAMKRFGAAREAMAASTLEYVYDIREVLTPAQRTKLTSVIDQGTCGLSCGMGLRGRGMMGPGAGNFGGPGQGRRWRR